VPVAHDIESQVTDTIQAGRVPPYQERRIRYFHDNIDRYLALEPL
jgi:hypothetical protein